MVKGIIFDIKRYAIHDGPGIRTTVFFKGCPLHCWWCHNPEGVILEPELIFKKNRCIKDCTECISYCKRGALSSVGQYISINREKCNLCSECIHVCPSGALEIIGKEMSVREVMEEIEKEIIFYDESGGGVTFSGGEPLMQPEFLSALLKECKERNIHIAMDTCGYAPSEIINRISDKVDFFLYDIKMMDAKKHQEYTGMPNKLILENLKKLAGGGNILAVRFPVVPGINDDSDNIKKMAEFILSLKTIEDISLLPYHRAGSEKYKRLDRADRMEEIQPPSDEKIIEIKKKLEHYGFKVKIGS